MDSTQHQRPKMADFETSDGETDESSIAPGNFWREHTLDELAAQQGITVPQPLDEMIGAAAELWDDDEDRDRFVQEIHDRRLQLRDGGEGES